MTPDKPLSAVKLVQWSHTTDVPAPTGSLEWSGGGWKITGDAAWLLDDYFAVLPTVHDGSRRVDPAEGVAFLYAVYFSMRATYLSMTLYNAIGEELSRDESLEGIRALETLEGD
jgi:hypothetical protein